MRRFACYTLLTLLAAAPASWAQFDTAVYESFTRHSPAMFSIEVEVPKSLVMKKYEDSVSRLQEFHDRYSNLVMSGTQPAVSFFMLDNMIEKWKRQLDFLKQQMLDNNRLRGAGFAIDPMYIVTVSSVVQNATVGGTIRLIDNDNKEYNASLQGINWLTGVAVLKVEDATLERYIDPDRLSTGLPVSSYVMTIQRPYKLPPSPFPGMIGGYYRQLDMVELERYIQTDLPLYPGNEGAPVLSPSGQLVGMMAAEFHVGAWPGVSFAIPADLVMDSAREIIERGGMQNAWIPGIELKQTQYGILITKIEDHSPAAHSGLKPGDIIVGFAGQEEKKLWNLISNIVHSEPRENVSFEVMRGPQRLQVQVELTTRVYQR